MVIILISNALLGYLISIAFSKPLLLIGVVDYIGNWAFAANDLFQGTSYPITLLKFKENLDESVLSKDKQGASQISIDTQVTESHK